MARAVATSILNNGRKAVEDLNLLKVLQLEIKHEQSSDRLQVSESYPQIPISSYGRYVAAHALIYTIPRSILSYAPLCSLSQGLRGFIVVSFLVRLKPYLLQRPNLHMIGSARRMMDFGSIAVTYAKAGIC